MLLLHSPPPAEVVRGRLQDEVASLTQRVADAEAALAAAVESSTAATASSATAESRSKTLTAQVARLQQKLGAASRAARANRATLEKAEQTQALLVRNLRVLKKCLLLAEHRIRASYGPAHPRYLSRAPGSLSTHCSHTHTARGLPWQRWIWSRVKQSWRRWYVLVLPCRPN